jgi:hypothetical protein
MKFLFVMAMVLTSSRSYSATPGDTMPLLCQELLIRVLGEGTLEMSTPEIILELKADWTLNPHKATADFGYCGNSEFFSIKVDKATCEVLELNGGDSDGDCHE